MVLLSFEPRATLASAKPHVCFFTTFCAFAAFLVKSTKKLSLLLFRVLFRLIEKVTHLSKALQLKKYIKSTFTLSR